MSWGLREQEETRSMVCCLVLSYSIEKAWSSEIELQHEGCMQRTGFSRRPQPYFPSFLLSHHHSSLHFSLKPHSGAQSILTPPLQLLCGDQLLRFYLGNYFGLLYPRNFPLRFEISLVLILCGIWNDFNTRWGWGWTHRNPESNTETEKSVEQY